LFRLNHNIRPARQEAHSQTIAVAYRTRECHEAKPAPRLLADQGRELLPMAIICRALLVASMTEKTR